MRVFLGKSTTKSGRARVVEFSQNETCRRPGRRPETRTLCLVGSGPVGSGSVRVRLVEFGLYTAYNGAGAGAKPPEAAVEFSRIFERLLL